MIVDELRHWRYYHLGSAWNKAFDFLISLTPDIEEGEYPLQGNEIFARIMSYETRNPGSAVLEAHRKYVDVQTVLLGREGIEWFPVHGLKTDMPYDESKDAEFFSRPYPGPARVELCAGVFAAFFPHDAHMPSLIIGDTPERVKKVVVKIIAELLNLRRRS